MTDIKRKTYYCTSALRECYRDGRLDDSQVARLRRIGFAFDVPVFDSSKDSLAAQYPLIAEQWDYERNGDVTPLEVTPLSTTTVWWRCTSCGRPYKLTIRSKTRSNSGCPYCGFGGVRAKVRLPVIRLDTLKSYQSIKAAERDVGYNLTYAIRSSKKDGRGVAWCYLIDYEMGRIPHIEKRNRFGSVICLETGQRFKTQKIAEEELGISAGSISRCLNKDKTAGGYHWVTESNYTEEMAVAARAAERYKVICLETGTRYETYVLAARDLNISEMGIALAVKRKSHYTAGYHFMKCSEYNALSKEEVEDVLKMGGPRPVACVETGVSYENITAAAETYPIGKRTTARSRIGACCRNAYSVFDGKHWCYAEDLQSRKDNADKYKYSSKTAVRCVETGMEYQSLAEAARDSGVLANTIRLAAKGDRRTAGGFTWEYVDGAPRKHGHKRGNQPSAKRVRCVETGRVFTSLGDAARTLGLKSGNSIKYAIDRCGTSGSYHWEYVDEEAREEG